MISNCRTYDLTYARLNGEIIRESVVSILGSCEAQWIAIARSTVASLGRFCADSQLTKKTIFFYIELFSKLCTARWIIRERTNRRILNMVLAMDLGLVVHNILWSARTNASISIGRGIHDSLFTICQRRVVQYFGHVISLDVPTLRSW